jgi:methanogenic corrinoid protein MtbC1
VVALGGTLDSGPQEFRQRLLKALIAGKQMSAEAIMLEQWGEAGHWEIVGDSVGVMLAEMGEAWSAGRLSITEEHVASETLLRSLARIQMMMPGRDSSKVCALATAPGDEHTLGLAMTELVLAEHGWQTIWLGRFSPVETLCEVAARADVQMVAISASGFSSMPSGLGDLVMRLGPVALAANTQLVLGGSGAWPENVFGVVRVRNHADFGEFLRDRASKGERS